jgi:perosamine synthetase
MCFKNNIDNIYNNWFNQNDLILQSRPNFSEEEALACYNYMHEGDNFVTEFKQTELLEKMICDYIGCKYCIMTTSGTSALIISLLALDIKQGDEVIVPNYTMIATINAIKNTGATPVIIDVDENTFTINKELVEKAITHKTKAVMHVSLNNRISKLEDLVTLCNEKNIYLIEDSAQSLGCIYNNKHLGTYGKIGCFSLSTPKIISTGQGGFTVTDDETLFKKMTMIKNFGRKQGGVDDFEVYGLNFKFTDIQAVIGIEQMKKLKDRVTRMKEIFNLYYTNLKNENIILKSNYENWIPWFIDIFTDNRTQLINFLKIHNIQTRVTYPEINKTPMYLADNTFENSNYISNYGLFLPSHTLLTNSEINYICELIKLFNL